MLRCISFVSLAAVCSLATAEETTAKAARPNVLFIAIDDLNDWTGFLGGQPGARSVVGGHARILP